MFLSSMHIHEAESVTVERMEIHGDWLVKITISKPGNQPIEIYLHNDPSVELNV